MQPVNGKAVTIDIYPWDNNPYKPRARVRNCSTANINYISQNEKYITTTTRIITKSYKIQSFKFGHKYTKKNMLTANQNFDITPKRNMESFKNNLFKNCKDLTNS